VLTVRRGYVPAEPTPLQEKTMTEKDIKDQVKEAYGLAALQVEYGLACGCVV